VLNLYGNARNLGQRLLLGQRVVGLAGAWGQDAVF
jgi:hypothetical protein